MIYALDPGYEESAIVALNDTGTIVLHEIKPNDEIRTMLHHVGQSRDLQDRQFDDVLVTEWIESYGMAVGREVFMTCLWVGRFVEAWGGRFELMPRRTVKLHLCQSARATDSNIRMALIDRFGPGLTKAIGTKKAQGPLYGITKHKISALAVGLTWWDTRYAQTLSNPDGAVPGVRRAAETSYE